LHQRNKGHSASWTERLLRESRVGHLATCNLWLKPHVVPVCFVFHDDAIYSPIDEKPKRKKPPALQRIINIEANPNVCMIVDRYEENWRKLRFVIIHGKAKLIWSGEEHQRAISQLRRKYHQYRLMNLQSRPIIKIIPGRTVSWRSDELGVNIGKNDQAKR
jgi:PPOX class probable F420-dependent enzyme